MSIRPYGDGFDFAEQARRDAAADADIAELTRRSAAAGPRRFRLAAPRPQGATPPSKPPPEPEADGPRDWIAEALK
jgi:hypothetical protein